MSSLQPQPITQAQRRRAMVAAVASVRAEGLEPPVATLQRFERYVEGGMTLDQLQRENLADAQALGVSNIRK